MQLEKFAAVLLCLCALCCSTAYAQHPAQSLVARNALNGKWKAELIPDDGGNNLTDNITFKAGKFSSEKETGDGYDDAVYEEDPSPQGISSKFSVTLTNKQGDTAKWSGFSTGTDMEGTLVITKKNGRSISYSFKATKS